MKYEVYVERKMSMMPYENMSVGYSHSFDDDTIPHDEGFRVVAESKRVGVKNFEVRDPILDMLKES